MKQSIALGVDIGGSHITAALVDLEKQSLVPDSQIRRHINAQGTAEAIIDQWSSVIGELLQRFPGEEIKIGMAIPGPFDYKEGIALMQNQNKYDALYGLNIKDLLAQKLGVPKKNFEFMNDAECFLQGEAFAGAARGVRSAMGITLGTGLGSARYQAGRAHDADLWCSPFLDGIAEDYLSTRWFIRRYYDLTGKKIREVKDLVSECSCNREAQQVFGEFGHNLALFLKGFMSKEQPEAIVLGGNIARAYDLFAPSLLKELQPWASTSLQVATLGEESGMIGAASCWYIEEERTVNENHLLQ